MRDCPMPKATFIESGIQGLLWKKKVILTTYGANNLVFRVLSLHPSRKYPGFGWSRVSLKQTAPHQGGLAFLQEAKGKANANIVKLARKQRNGSH